MKTVILIGHKKRQGKDTLAKMLSEITGGEIVRFADPIKAIIADTFGMTIQELEDAKNDGEYIHHSTWSEEWNSDEFPGGDRHTYRQVLQRFGQSMKNHFEEDVWASLATENVWDCNTDVVIIPDLRFDVEYLTMWRAFLKENVITVNVTRPGHDSSDEHESETELDGFAYDHTITNDGTLEALREKAELLWEEIRQGML